MTDKLKLEKRLAKKKEEIKVLGKRENELLVKLNKFHKLQEVRKLKAEKEVELKTLEILKAKEECKSMNDLEINIAHTRQGLKRRDDRRVEISEGNLHRLVDAFMYFVEFSDKTLPILDVGTREGWFLEFLLKVGYTDVRGIEISPEAVAIVKSKGLNVIEIDVREMTFKEEFGTITLIHLIEHCSNPQKVVEVVYNALKEGGILYLEIPLEINFLPFRSGHFCCFPEPGNLFALFDNAKWSMLSHEVITINAAGSKRNLKVVFKKGRV